MKIIFSLLFVFGYLLSSNAQVIEKRYDVFDQTKGSAVVQTSDGGFITVGQDYDIAPGKKGALFFKLNAAGDLLWHTFIHQEEGNSTTLKSVVETTDGAFVVMGSSIKYNTPDPGNVTSTIAIKFNGD
ncbi:MAG: hypothetical protein GQ574_19980 [Crocinitomix sp.]|nr:hypothetical protein [Crocinitomix sp.]